ncbi:MarR family transcriptional regulator [Acidipropionibacterium jensenii]|uniref:MarR family winged helix-turn-helix transcriptional regulator n=1 Tax=Acidipropionibacterium jensenii TaxID=1749 RepID=UPI000BC2FBDB|nr:MarR family winged helix-turn-helix transcriptional regulator [Acidipropionibacterium jensenii]AZZ42520.1 MarR family transcriptional regulator [Acidipropionibacterium jensenii]
MPEDNVARQAPAPAHPGTTPWLDEEQQRVWRDWLKASATVDRVLDANLRAQGLGLGEYEVLIHLSEAPERSLRMGALARLVRASRSRMTHTVARLENLGMVERRPASHDRRGVMTHLTDAGHARLVEVAPLHLQAVRRVFIDAIDPADLSAVGRALRAVLGAVGD